MNCAILKTLLSYFLQWLPMPHWHMSPPEWLIRTQGEARQWTLATPDWKRDRIIQEYSVFVLRKMEQVNQSFLLPKCFHHTNPPSTCSEAISPHTSVTEAAISCVRAEDTPLLWGPSGLVSSRGRNVGSRAQLRLTVCFSWLIFVCLWHVGP